MNFQSRDLEKYSEELYNSKIEKNGFTYFFTKDSDMIEKYIDLRKKLYITDERFVGFREFDDFSETVEDYQADNSILLLAFKGNECVGGGRISISFPNQSNLLPLEHDVSTKDREFKIVNKFPYLEGEICGEVNRFAIHPDYRDIKLIADCIYILTIVAKTIGARELFALSDIGRVRLYQMLSNKHLGFKSKIYRDLQINGKDIFEGHNMYITSIDLNDVMIDSSQNLRDNLFNI